VKERYVLIQLHPPPPAKLLQISYLIRGVQGDTRSTMTFHQINLYKVMCDNVDDVMLTANILPACLCIAMICDMCGECSNVLYKCNMTIH